MLRLNGVSANLGGVVDGLRSAGRGRHTRLVAHLPKSDASLLVRVTERDDAAWARLQGAVATENPDGFRAYVEFIDAAE
jgi:hypothetical protein